MKRSCMMLLMTAISICVNAVDWSLYIWSDNAYAADSTYKGEDYELTADESLYTADGITLAETGVKYCIHNADWSVNYGWSEEATGVVKDPGEDVVMGLTTQASGWLAIHPGQYSVVFNPALKTIRFEVYCPTGYKRVSVLGDSYSTMYGWVTPNTNENFFPRFDVQQAEQTWWYQVVNSGNYVLERLNAYSGSTMMNNTLNDWRNPNEKMDVSTSFISRCTNLGNPDIILICGGTNDEWNNDNSMGEYKYSDWTDSDLLLFRPGTAYLFHLVKTSYPYAKVYFVLNDILPRVSESIKTICAHYNIPVAAPQGIEKDETTHPSPAGMTTIAEAVKMVLSQSTGIGQVRATTKTDGVYNLAGQRVNDDAKGLLVYDGKKMIVK